MYLIKFLECLKVPSTGVNDGPAGVVSALVGLRVWGAGGWAAGGDFSQQRQQHVTRGAL